MYTVYVLFYFFIQFGAVLTKKEFGKKGTKQYRLNTIQQTCRR